MNRSPRLQAKTLQMGETMEAAGIEPAQDSPRLARAREQVRTDFKPEPTPKRPSKGLRRTAGFRRNPPLAAQFRFAVLHEFGGRCIMLGSALSERVADGPRSVSDVSRVASTRSESAHICDGPLDPAHLIPKATLRKLGLPETVVFDHRNGVAACRRAHDRNDSGLERFPRELLPPSVEEFAKAHGLSYLLDKSYPKAAA